MSISDILINIFEYIIKMSIAGSVLAIVVIIFRILLKNKMPKILLLVLWAIVFLKLIMPIEIPSPIGIWNTINLEQTTQGILTNTNLFGLKETPLEQRLVQIPSALIEETQTYKPLAYIYFIGVGISLVALVFLYIHTYSRLRTSVLVKYQDTNFYVSNQVSSPLIFGFFRPKIIMPKNFDLNNTITLEHVILHEKQHIKNLDNLWNLLSLLILCLHWFNPLIWVARIFLNKDIEGYCDYRVIKSLGSEHKREYANSLLDCAVYNKKLSPALIVGFGESNVSSRIKGVLKYKRFDIIARIVSVIIMLVVVVVFAMGSNKVVKLTSDIPPLKMPSDFNFSIKYGVRGNEQVDTYHNKFTKDLINDGTKTAKLKIPENKMREFYDYFLEYDIVTLPSQLDTGYSRPSYEYLLTVTYSGNTKTIEWKGGTSLDERLPEENIRLLKFIKIIDVYIMGTSAYRSLPDPKGGYN